MWAGGGKEASSILFPPGLLIAQNTSAGNVRHTLSLSLSFSSVQTHIALSLFHFFSSSSRSPAVHGFDMHQACLGH